MQGGDASGADWRRSEGDPCARKKAPPGGEEPLLQVFRGTPQRAGGFASYLGGAGVNPSRLRPGSGFGLGLGAFFGSFLPLSLLPMGPSVPQKAGSGKAKKAERGWRHSAGGRRSPCGLRSGGRRKAMLYCLCSGTLSWLAPASACVW